MLQRLLFCYMVIAFMPYAPLLAQNTQDQSLSTFPKITNIEPQPLLAQAIRLNDALSFLGSSLSENDQKRLKALQDKPLTEKTSQLIQQILDPYCLAFIEINPESRVSVLRGPAKAELIQHGWRTFLVKVHNEAGTTAQLKVESQNSKPAFHIASFPIHPHTLEKNLLSAGQVVNRFMEIQMYSKRPLLPNLSGLSLEYAVVQLYSKDSGNREAQIGFNIGQGTQDIGFRNTINILFNIQPSVKVVLHVLDDDGSPTTASFIFSDGIERVIDDSIKAINNSSYDYRFTLPVLEYHDPWYPPEGYIIPTRLKGLYPLPSRRVAAYDEYPDFFFEPQVYRADGEHILLPPGKYKVTYTRGPEYITQTKTLVVPAGVDSIQVSFKLKRWINMAQLGWYSADHHIHAAGCSHYESPEEGVNPQDMWRRILGEDLNVGEVLSWGPGWYHQKSFFTGTVHPLSTSKNIMRYDVEVSGFPSSHAGHLVLLGLHEQDYPGTTQIEDWPSYTLPILKWAKGQGAVTGYAHSGWGLEPINEKDYGTDVHNRNFQLPNYNIPKMDGIGANEYIVAVTQNAVDVYSAGDTPAPWELNMWYHTLNCGFRPRLSGETDYPCIFDERVGIGRSYFKTDSALTYDSYITAIKNGRSYVSDGGSHIIKFSVNGIEAGTNNSELQLTASQMVKVTAQVTAYLPEQQDEQGAGIAKSTLDKKPYWNIKRARIGDTRQVAVELIVNGEPVDTATIIADGQWKDIHFQYPVQKSGWMALRIFPSSHTNPVFIILNGKPIYELKSAQWCRQAVDQCWKMKQGNIRDAEREAAAAAYDSARKVYDSIIQQATNK
jgi:hypothetical protein